MTDETLASRKFRASDAKALLDNKLFKDAFQKLGDNLEAQALACDPDNKDKAARIIIAKQLLKGIKREIERVIDDGDVADIQLSELERKKQWKFLR
jgi:hypothetical protein